MKIKSIRVLNCNYNDGHVYMDETGFGLEYDFNSNYDFVIRQVAEDGSKTIISVLRNHSITCIEYYESTKGSINNEQ